MTENTITLKVPVIEGGHEYKTLTMREPKVRDQVNAKGQSGSDADYEVQLFANLCEVPPAVVEELTMRDYLKLQAIYSGFLS